MCPYNAKERPMTGGSPHKGPVIRKMFLCSVTILNNYNAITLELLQHVRAIQCTIYHIAAETKMADIWLFQIHFVNKNVDIFIRTSMKFDLKDLIENKASLVLVIVGHNLIRWWSNGLGHKYFSRPQCAYTLNGLGKWGISGPVFCLLLGVSSGCARPITGQVTSVTWPVIGRALSELTPSKRQKTGPDHDIGKVAPHCYHSMSNVVKTYRAGPRIIWY